MILRAVLFFAPLFCITGSTSVWGQGKILSGFEEYPVDTRPLFVKLDFTTTSNAAIADTSTRPSFVPYGGQQFLWGAGSIFLESPDGQPIQSYTLHAFVHTTPPNTQLAFGIQGRDNQPLQLDVWQTIHGSFDTPAQRININSFYSEGERFAWGFAIDNVEFTTIPEPQTYWLLPLGLGAILLRRSKSLKIHSG